MVINPIVPSVILRKEDAPRLLDPSESWDGSICHPGGGNAKDASKGIIDSFTISNNARRAYHCRVLGIAHHDGTDLR